MIGSELADRVLEGHEGIVGAYPSTTLLAELVELAEHGVKPLVRLRRRLIRIRDKSL